MPLNYSALGYNEQQNIMFQDAEKVIDKLNLWEWLKNLDEPIWGGFSDMECEEIELIGHHMTYTHETETFNHTMRAMQLLAVLGIDEFCSSKAQRIAPPAAPKKGPIRSPEMDMKVLNEFKTRPPFVRAPKWSAEYVKAFPDVVRNISF